MAGGGAKPGVEERGAASEPEGLIDSPITLVFVDLINSTALKAALPGGDVTTRNRAYFEMVLTPYRQRVEADLSTFGGRVVNTWGDDQFLIFASATQAVKWAAAVQSRQSAAPITTPLGPMQVRIGMHTGAPLTDPRDSTDYIGHEVDYAKRVSAFASGGQILLSETTATLVRDARVSGLALHSHGQRALKGIGRVLLFELLHEEKRPQPLDASAALTPLVTVDTGPLPTGVLLDKLVRSPIVGRESELGELRRRVDAAVKGTGTTVFLSGEPGIGKTRLARETTLYALLYGFQVLSGRCEEEGTSPYQPFAEAVREYVNGADPARLEKALPPPVAGELIHILPSIASKVPEVPQLPPLPPEQARQALLEAVQQFFAAVATREAPLLLFLDDLHWADEGSLAMLHSLARHGRNLALLIVGTYREVGLDTRHPLERTLSAMNRERLFQSLSLHRLPEAGVAEMVSAILAEASPPAAFVSELYQETEGNPFFIEEMLKHLVEEGAIARKDDHWQITPLQEIGVPRSIKVTIGRRLERLGNESQAALGLAAVIGQQFGFEVLREASGLPEEQLLAIVEEWLDARLVIEERRGREDLYRFQHALIREVSYAALSRRRKARLHERVGLALEAAYPHHGEEHLAALAYHFSQARSGAAVEKGIDYRLRAGEKARNLYANEEAIHHLTTALDLLDGLPEDESHLRKRWEVVFNLQQCYLSCRALEQAQEVLQDYLALAQRAAHPWGVADAHRWLARALKRFHWLGRIDGGSACRLGVEHFEQSVRIAEQYQLTDRCAWARVGLAELLSEHGADLPRAEALLRETLKSPESLPQEVVQETYRVIMDTCARQGKWDEFTAALRQSIPFGGPSSLVLSLGPMEDALNRAGKSAEFVAFLEEAKTLYNQAGLPFTLNQWHLEPTTPSEEFRHLSFRDDFDAPELHLGWQWHDPLQASGYSLQEKSGHLTLRAARGTDLYPGTNLNAPRMLLELRGDFSLEAKMVGDWDERTGPGIGGLVVWKDVLSYIRFDRFSLGLAGPGDVRLEARVAGAYEMFGRGRLRGETHYLRLERTGDRFAALCSNDGVHWLTCGHVNLPVKDPLTAGVCAGHGMVAHVDYVQVLGRG